MKMKAFLTLFFVVEVKGLTRLKLEFSLKVVSYFEHALHSLTVALGEVKPQLSTICYLYHLH